MTHIYFYVLSQTVLTRYTSGGDRDQIVGLD